MNMRNPFLGPDKLIPPSEDREEGEENIEGGGMERLRRFLKEFSLKMREIGLPVTKDDCRVDMRFFEGREYLPGERYDTKEDMGEIERMKEIWKRELRKMWEMGKIRYPKEWGGDIGRSLRGNDKDGGAIRNVKNCSSSKSLEERFLCSSDFYL